MVITLSNTMNRPVPLKKSFRFIRSKFFIDNPPLTPCAINFSITRPSTPPVLRLYGRRIIISIIIIIIFQFGLIRYARRIGARYTSTSCRICRLECREIGNCTLGNWVLMSEAWSLKHDSFLRLSGVYRRRWRRKIPSIFSFQISRKLDNVDALATQRHIYNIANIF